MKKTLKYIKEAKWNVFAYVFAGIVEAIIGVLFPIFSAKIILNITNNEMNQLILSAVVILLFEIFRCLTGTMKSIFYNKIHRKTIVSLQTNMIKETLRIEVSEIDKQTTGLFIDRLNKDADTISRMLIDISYWITNILGNIGILVAMFMLNKYLFVYAIFTSISIFLLSKRRVNKEGEVRRKISRLSEEKTGLVGETIRGIRDVKVLNAVNNLANQTNNKINDVTQAEMKLIYVNNIYSGLETLARAFVEFFFIIIGVILYKKGLLSIPVFIIAYHYQPRVRTLLNGLSYLIDCIKQFDIASSRVYEIIDNHKFKKEKFGSKDVERLNGNIEFKKVSFAYDKNKQ